MKTAFVSGITGQDAAYLAQLLLHKGYTVYGGARRNASGSLWRLERLGIEKDVQIVPFELTELPQMMRTLEKIQPDEIYNLAAQTFVKVSFDEPLHTVDVTGVGAVRLIEAVRKVYPGARYYQASSIAIDTPVLVRHNNRIQRASAATTMSWDHPFEILSRGKDGTVGFFPVRKTLDHGMRETIRVKTRGMGEVIVTADHSLFIWTPKGVSDVATGDIHVGDFLVTYCDQVQSPKSPVAVETKYEVRQHIPSRWTGTYGFRSLETSHTYLIDKDLARLCGYFVADGYCNVKPRQQRVSFTFGHDDFDRPRIQETKDLLRRYFDATVSEQVRPTSTQVYASGRRVAEFFRLCGLGAYHKRVPWFIWQSPRECVVEFLRGYSGDAKHLQDGSLVFTTVNRDLQIDVLYLCRMNGIPARLYRREVGEHLSPQQTIIKAAVCHDVHVPAGFLYGERIQGARTPAPLCVPTSVETYANVIPINARHKRLVGRSRLNTDIGGIGVAEVVAIEKGPLTRVMDYEVPGAETFFCGTHPFLAHNSSEMFGNAPTGYYVKIDDEFADGTDYRGYNEESPMHPRSPYGYAKLLAYFATRNAREAHGLFACNGILFNHECVSSNTPLLIRTKHGIDVRRPFEIMSLAKKGKSVQAEEIDGTEIWDGTSWETLNAITARRRDPAINEQRMRWVESRTGVIKATQHHMMRLDSGDKCPVASLIPENYTHEVYGPTSRLDQGVWPQAAGWSVCSSEMAEFFGYMVADGWIHENGNSIHYTKNDDQLRGRVVELWSRLFLGTASEFVAPSGFNPGRTVKHVRLAGAGLATAKWLRGQLYTRDAFKKVPPVILNADLETQRVFLDAYYAGDGLKVENRNSFKTNSAVLAQALCWMYGNQGLASSIYVEQREDREYFQINLLSANRKGQKGQHLAKDPQAVRKISKCNIEDEWVFDLAVDSGKFCGGIGRLVVANSPLRGREFVTRKITEGVARIVRKEPWFQLRLGNLEAKRDWGHARDYVRAMHLMLQHDTPDDYVVATGETHSVREFVEAAFRVVGKTVRWVQQECWVGSTRQLEWGYVDDEPVIMEDPAFYRPAEVDCLIGNAAKAKRVLGWQPEVTFEGLVQEMVESELCNR